MTARYKQAAHSSSSTRPPRFSRLKPIPCTVFARRRSISLYMIVFLFSNLGPWEHCIDVDLSTTRPAVFIFYFAEKNKTKKKTC
jgi:hypothetical protein